MSDSDVFKERRLYENEEVIAKTINHLRLSDPENASRDYAIGFLKYMQRYAFHAEKANDFNYDDFFKKYKESKNK